MNKITGVGIIAIIAGLALAVFKMIGSVTSKSFKAADYTLEQFMKPEHIDSVGTITNSMLRSCADSVITAPLYLHLIIIGVIIAVIGGLTADR